MKTLYRMALLAGLAVTTAVPAHAEIKVVASIKPVHSLVSSIMQGVGEPGLIIDGAGSPHGYSMKPSQAQMLEKAGVVFWIGHELETFLERPVETIGANAKSVELIDTAGLEILAFREGGAFSTHHEDHDDDHGHDADHDDYDHDADHDDHDQHEHGHAHHGTDPHIWLDPKNAKILASRIAAVLSELDPANGDRYAANEAALQSQIDALIGEVDQQLAPVRNRGFVVFHDAYHYFEHRFDLEATGSITINPEVMPGAERLSEIREKISSLGVTCVFAEPQFPSSHIDVVTEGTQTNVGILDPLGSSLENGPDLYPNLIRAMAVSIRECLN